MPVFVSRAEIVDAGHNHRVDDDDLTKEDNFAAWNPFSKERPGSLTVCLARVHFAK
jgi:hypothetical protein